MMAHGVGGAIASLSWLNPLLGERNANAAESIPWGYGQENGPKVWSQLSESYQTCATGIAQSPIDLVPIEIEKASRSLVAPNLQPSEIPIFHYRPMPLTILNTGRTIQVNGDGKSFIELGGDRASQRFTLRQLHFHHPSEHRLDGDRFPMEMHLVHANKQGKLAVVGVFLKEGSENRRLKPVWKSMTSHQSKAVTIPGATIDVEGLLPSDRALFRYSGSLTTPPCSEAVQWMVFKTPIELSAQQVAAFKAIFPLNARPIQPMNHRRLS